MSMSFTLGAMDHCSNHYNHSDFMSIRPEYQIVQDKSAGDDSIYKGRSYRPVMDYDALRVNGLKIFTAVALHAWRSRRKELKQLTQSVEELRESSIRTKNQLHVYSALITVEQNRNDELTCQLQRTLDTFNKSRSSCEAMSSTVISMKASKDLLEEELKLKYEEYDALHAVLAQTKTDLFRSIMDQRNLRSQLCKEQRTVQSLENQKNRLITEICSINGEKCKAEENFQRQLKEKEQQLTEMKAKLDVTESALAKLNAKLNAEENRKNDYEVMAEEIERLRRRVIFLQEQHNDNSKLCNRLRMYWGIFVDYRKSTFRYAHILAYCLLPATPPPPKFACKSKRF